MAKKYKIPFLVLFSILGGASIGAIISALMSGGFTLAGFAGASALTALCLFFLLLVWKWGGAGRTLAWMMGLAFALRLILGIGLSLALPVYGYDTPTQNAGYIFFDAYQRDLQAWDLAQDGGSLLRAFQGEYFADQYGGMMAISASIYRLFSPDAHRPWLVLILTASFGSLGIPFLRRGLHEVFDGRIADAAAWIFALYPESLLLGGSQMRDQILIGLSAVAFWGAMVLCDQRKAGWAALITSIFVMAAFSWLVAAPVLAVLMILIWVREQQRYSRRVRSLVWVGIAAFGLAGLASMAGWLRSYAIWDAKLTAEASGWLQFLFDGKPDWFRYGFLVAYGLVQPVLPAAVFDPALPLSNGITTFRALGWYLLLPVLLYVPFGLSKEAAGQKRGLLILAFAAFVSWTIISSLRAGGDLWDNPRYRTSFLVWMAIIAAWGWITAKERKDPWLARWIGAEAVFLLVFSIWYGNRLYRWGFDIPFYGMVALIVLAAGFILISGAIYDHIKTVRNRKISEQ